MGTDGYSHGSDHLKTCVDVDVSALKFLQRFPLLWFRKRTDATPKETQQSAFEEAEAGKRELATLIDIKVGQLKFATAKELKTQFHASKAGLADLSSLPKDVMVLIHPDLRLLDARSDVVLHHGAKPHATPWFSAETLAAAVMLSSSQQLNNVSFLEQLDRGVRVTEPQLVQVRCPKCGRLGALANAPPAPPTWRCNGCRGRGDPEGCRNARRAVAAYRSGHYRGEATLKSMLQSAIKRGHAEVALL